LRDSAGITPDFAAFDDTPDKPTRGGSYQRLTVVPVRSELVAIAQGDGCQARGSRFAACRVERARSDAPALSPRGRSRTQAATTGGRDASATAKASRPARPAHTSCFANTRSGVDALLVRSNVCTSLAAACGRDSRCRPRQPGAPCELGSCEVAPIQRRRISSAKVTSACAWRTAARRAHRRAPRSDPISSPSRTIASVASCATIGGRSLRSRFVSAFARSAMPAWFPVHRTIWAASSLI
jgi:hypothetical protein